MTSLREARTACPAARSLPPARQGAARDRARVRRADLHRRRRLARMRRDSPPGRDHRRRCGRRRRQCRHPRRRARDRCRRQPSSSLSTIRGGVMSPNAPSRQAPRPLKGPGGRSLVGLNQPRVLVAAITASMSGSSLPSIQAATIVSPSRIRNADRVGTPVMPETSRSTSRARITSPSQSVRSGTSTPSVSAHARCDQSESRERPNGRIPAAARSLPLSRRSRSSFVQVGDQSYT